MIDLDEIFLNILKIFLIELKVILLYCINRITSDHLIAISDGYYNNLLILFVVYIYVYIL